MAKAIKKVIKKKALKEDKLPINGSFLDIMQAAVKQANKKSAKKKA